MSSVQQFVDECQRPGANCVSVVRECITHDARMHSALDVPADAFPIDLLTVASERAAAAGIPETWPGVDDFAVGFVNVMGRATCAVHFPQCGWWALSRLGATPVPAHRITIAYEVKPCPL